MPRKLASALAVILLAVSAASCARPPAERELAAGAPDDAKGIVPGSTRDFAENVGDRVFFESDSSDLTDKAQQTLTRQAAWLKRYDRGPFTIEGHADERGTREYNFALGQRRAQTVKDYLQAKGIASTRIRTISFGKERPVAVCNDILCWSQNRRSVTNVGVGSQS